MGVDGDFGGWRFAPFCVIMKLPFNWSSVLQTPMLETSAFLIPEQRLWVGFHESVTVARQSWCDAFVFVGIVESQSQAQEIAGLVWGSAALFDCNLCQPFGFPFVKVKTELFSHFFLCLLAPTVAWAGRQE